MKKLLVCIVVLTLFSHGATSLGNSDDPIKEDSKTVPQDILNMNKDKSPLAILNEKHNPKISLKLQELYIEAETLDSKKEIIESMVYYGDRSNVPFLILLLKAEKTILHQNIIYGIRVLSSTYLAGDRRTVALGFKDSHGLKLAVKPLLEYADDKNNKVENRAAAIFALAHIPSSKEMMLFAGKCAQRWDQENNKEINKALSYLRNPSGYPDPINMNKTMDEGAKIIQKKLTEEELEEILRPVDVLSVGVFEAWDAPQEERWESNTSDSSDQIKESKAVEEAVKKIKKGMTEEEVNKILRPVVVASANTFRGEFNFYELKGNKELAIRFDYDGKRNTAIGRRAITPLSKWSKLYFRPYKKELSAAIEIAVRHMNQLIAKKEDLSALYRLSHRSIFATLDLERDVKLDSADGQEIEYKVTAKGSYSNHRLIELYFRLNKDDWKYHVIVDMNDRAVVPGFWTLTSKDIAKARIFADPVAEKDLGSKEGKSAEIKVKKARGVYNYGPTRRIVILEYSTYRLSTTIRVDLEKGVLLQ